MKKVTVLALTKMGQAAIEKHIKETDKLPWKKKMQFKAMGYRHEVSRKEYPAEVTLQIRNKVLENNATLMDLVIKELQKTMHSNGAEESDYRIKVD